MIQRFSSAVAGLVFAACLVAAPAPGKAVEPNHRDPAVVVPGAAVKAASRAVGVPKPLSDAEVAAYQKIFAYQAKGD